jgi:hypothetical protein
MDPQGSTEMAATEDVHSNQMTENDAANSMIEGESASTEKEQEQEQEAVATPAKDQVRCLVHARNHGCSFRLC